MSSWPTVLMNGMVVYLVDGGDTRHLTAFIAGLGMTKMYEVSEFVVKLIG